MDYNVTYNNKTISLNQYLIKKQKINNKSIKRILTLHFQKMILFEAMKKIDNSKKLKEYDQYLNEIETELQWLWKLDYNPNFFRFWDRPKCTCPKMDNDDRYPIGYYVINSDCPLHGE
jgi:hypothetical protein